LSHLTNGEALVRALVAEHLDATLVELCELLGHKRGNWVSRTAMCRCATKIRTQSLKKTWYTSQAATERGQKLRVEYGEKIKNIEPENLVFLDENVILLGLSRTHSRSQPGTRVSKKNILSGRKSYSHWHN